ncbi:unnamed protein product [Schistocephalus solidus]|uniref:Bromo domain-containing protein n=1 Tax=Schistocephalus solidus TaxID=70667 RepID=A0A183SWF9_SCHSO|nr:unnamed protein product [Schistocephalus solidus]
MFALHRLAYVIVLSLNQFADRFNCQVLWGEVTLNDTMTSYATPEELAEMSPEQVEELKNKVKAERMRAKVEAAMAARVKAAADRRQRERGSRSSSSSNSSTAASRLTASSAALGAQFEIRDGPTRRRRHRHVSSSSSSYSSSSSEAYLDELNEGLAAEVHTRRLAREAKGRDRYDRYSGSDEGSYDDDYSEDDDDDDEERQGRSRRRRHRHGRREDEDYEDDEEDEEQGHGRRRRHHHHRRRRDADGYDDDDGEEEEGDDGRRKRHHHHRHGERRRRSDDDEYDDREEDGSRHRRGRRRRGGRPDDEDSMEDLGRGRRKHRHAMDEEDDGGYYYDLDARGKRGKRRKQEGLQHDRYEHAVQERQVGIRRGRRSSQYFHDYDDEGGVLGYRHGLHHRAQSAGGFYPSGFGPKAGAPRTPANPPQALPAVQVRLWQPLVRTVGRVKKRGEDVVEKVVVSADSVEEQTSGAPAKHKDDRDQIVRRGVSAEESKREASMEHKDLNEDSVLENEPADDKEGVEKVATRAYSDVQEVSIGKIAFSKFRMEKLIPANKLVHAIKRKAKEVAFISPEMLERRQKTRKLLEKMQHQLGMASGEEGTAMHPLTIDQIKEALQNPEFAEIAKEFQQLQGTQILGQDPQSNTVLENIKEQMDMVMSKAGEKPNYDKMVNLYSLLREAERKSTLDGMDESEVKSEDLQLTPQETEYLRSLQQVVSERLLTEISVLNSLLPPERCAWMSLQENWENQRENLCVLAQLIQVESVAPDLASVIVSALLMNVADGVAALETTEMIPAEHRVIYYGYIRDSIEALSWFDIDVGNAKEIISLYEALESAGVGKQVAEEYMVIAKRVSPTKSHEQIEATYDTAVRLPITHLQSSLASVLSKQNDSDEDDVDLVAAVITATPSSPPKPSASTPQSHPPLHPTAIPSAPSEMITPQVTSQPQQRPVFRAHSIADRDWRRIQTMTNKIRQKKLSQRAAGLPPEAEPNLVRARPVSRAPAEFSKSSDSESRSVTKPADASVKTPQEQSTRTKMRARSSVNLSLILTGAPASKLASRMEKFLHSEEELGISVRRESGAGRSSIYDTLDRSSLAIRGTPAPILVPYASIEGHEVTSLRVASHAYPLNPDEIRLIEGTLRTGRQEHEAESVYDRYRARRTNVRITPSKAKMRRKSSKGFQIEEALDLEVHNSPAEIGFLTRNPDLVLQQLRSRLDPGTLSCMIEDIRNYPSVGRSRTMLAQAMTKAIDLQKNEVHAKAK